MENAHSGQPLLVAEAPRGKQPASSRANRSSTKAPQPSGTKSLRQTGLKRDNVASNVYMAQHDRRPPPSPWNMGDMMSAVPSYPCGLLFYDQRCGQQHLIPSVHPQSMVYPMLPMPPFSGETIASDMSAYGPQVTQRYTSYSPHQQSTPFQHGTPVNQPSTPFAHPGAGYQSTYHPAQPCMASSGYSPVYPHLASMPQSGLHHRNSQDPVSETSSPSPEREGQHAPSPEYDVLKTIVDGSTPLGSRIQSSSPGSPAVSPGISGSLARKGSPRKAKQSGHALWVGNLPSGASITDLKEFFARETREHVESVFLISKSNCAFVNYRTEAACMAALSRIHDSKYQGARLVCRPRRGDGSPAARPGATNGLTRSLSTKDQAARDTGGARARGDGSESERVAHRYFIVKSLTVEDLEASRRSGIWATQVQNEDVLNQAFQTADDVYLIFSANKSGEYYGYARMMSSIQENGDPTLQMPFRPRQSVPGSEELNLTATPATTFAPSGRIIRDLGRGTVFWEADSSEGEPEEEEERKEAGADDAADDESPGPEGVEVQSIGRPFRIQWLSAERVPFHRTRGLRNPWNGNRDVKVARDGTEIESTVGERLLGLFHSALPN